MPIFSAVGDFESEFHALNGIPMADQRPTEGSGDAQNQGATPVPSSDLNAPVSSSVAPRGIVEQDLTNQFNTPLNEDEQKDYNTKFSPNDSYDYDMQGWYKANPGADPKGEGVHYPDTFKKPNHMTFSDQSQYSNDQTPGGKWGDNDSFTPSSYNLQQHDPQTLKDYFAKVEPNSQLNLPDQDRSVVDKLLGRNGDRYQTWPERMVRGAISSMALPGQVLSGEVQPGSVQEIEKAADLAGLMVGGPAPVAAKMADGTLGSFAGVRSRLIDRDALAEAQHDIAGGMHPDDVVRDTGFFQGADSRWRYEIPDKDATINSKGFDSTITSNPNGEDLHTVSVKPSPTDFFGKVKDSTAIKLPDVLDHPELFQSYPHLNNTKVQPLPDYLQKQGVIGQMSPADNTLYLRNDLNPDFAKSVILHETQHAIQDYEGFARGGSQQEFTNPLIDKAEQELTNIKSEIEPKVKADLGGDDRLVSQVKNLIRSDNQGYLSNEGKNQLNKLKESQPLTYTRLKNIVESEDLIRQHREEAFTKYQRLMGEVEARNVQARMNFDQWDRKSMTPMQTESEVTPRFLQINPKR